MFDSFKKSFGTVLGTVVGLIAGSYILGKLNTHDTKKDEDEKEDYMEESN